MPTKRNVLRVIASFYDPMGLISPIIVQMKILLQDICKTSARHMQGRLPLECRTWLGTEISMDEVDLRVGAGERHSDLQMCHFRTWHQGTCIRAGGFRLRLILSLCSGGLFDNQIPNQYSSPIDCIKNSCCPTKEADHSKVGAPSCINIDKVDCTDQDNTGTMPRSYSCRLLNRLEECSVLD